MAGAVCHRRSTRGGDGSQRRHLRAPYIRSVASRCAFATAWMSVDRLAPASGRRMVSMRVEKLGGSFVHDSNISRSEFAARCRSRRMQRVELKACPPRARRREPTRIADSPKATFQSDSGRQVHRPVAISFETIPSNVSRTNAMERDVGVSRRSQRNSERVIDGSMILRPMISFPNAP